MVAIDRERGSLLLQSFGEDAFDPVSDPDILEREMRHLAEMQIGLALRLDALRELGVPERPLTGMGEHIAALLGDDHALRMLDAAQVERLRDNVDDFRMRCSAFDLESTHQSEARAILWHEFAHIVNDDVSKTSFTLSLW